ncbi:MAG: DEAD/DEAH box helicase [Treponema sp.]|jgi:ATP-dependent Lhr-like helicase|nr:DEAD/DEAH box helicase [Treponema sp.]
MLPETFHPVIRNWFTETYGIPTSVQAQAWPLIENGENVLALAPTGSGKTLTAFLSAISRFVNEGPQNYQSGKLSVLYVSPLKALNEDIKRNLLHPLAAIKTRFEKEGLAFPPVRVETRSGDTPQSERRRFFIRPPSILALTPESLAIILLNPRGRQVLSSVKYVIIDEIHALLGNKRGAYLSCQIDRLALIAGEFQRISLSATVRNPDMAAAFTGGTGRKVSIVSPPAEKKIDFSVEFPDAGYNTGKDAHNNEARAEKYGKRYTPLIDYILKRIREDSTLLVFAESRRRAERLCYFLNTEAAPSGSAVAFPHHGSLSKEIRRGVEKGLAEGLLPCVVATASLELGIDIGDIDEVVLAGSTGNVSQALQRIGRSGHGVGQVSKGRLFAFHGKDLLVAAALKSAVEDRDIEEINPIENPLDVLAQLILSLCCEKERNIEELYQLIKSFYIFKNLNYDSFNRVVHMLAGLSFKGKGEASRLRDIKPRIWFDKIEDKIGALDGTTVLLYSSGGVIANRGLFSLRLADGTRIGELDEEFVWERAIGDCFDFGARGWRITNIGPEAVEVTPLEKRADYIPFWKGEAVFRSANLTQRVISILDEYNRTNDISTCLAKEARESLFDFLDSQSRSQQAAKYNRQNRIPLPDSKNIVIEIIEGTELNRDFCSIVLHSFRGGSVNYPLSLALSMELSQAVNLRVEPFSNDDSILFLLPRLGLKDASLPPEEIFRRALEALEKREPGVNARGITRAERLFRNRLEASGVFGAAFREAAERSLLLPKAPFGKRTPLWIMRQRSKRLFDAVAGEDGFPVTTEAWRTCLVDKFDMDGFRSLVSAINDGSVTVSFFHTNIPSPFSRDMVREETNSFMYEYDERKDISGSARATLSDRIIEEAVNNSSLRPSLKESIVNDFVSRLRRETAGYAPDDILSLCEWIKERAVIPYDEWEILCAAMSDETRQNALTGIFDSGKIKIVTRNGTSAQSVIHREWEKAWRSEPLGMLGQWLRYEGPVSIERICAVFGVSESDAQDAVNALAEVDEIVTDAAILKDAVPPDSSVKTVPSLLICDRENLEMLLRLSRKKERPVIKERPSSLLAPFLALRQGLACAANENKSDIFVKSLYAWTAPAKLWETEILCARNSSYSGEKIDREIHDGQLVWYGVKGSKEKIGFCLPEDLDLAGEAKKSESKNSGIGLKMEQLASSEFFNRPRDFWEIKNELAGADSSGNSVSVCAKALWHEVWQGSLTSDSFEPVRKGLEFGFIPKEIDIPADQSRAAARPFGRHPRIPGALKNRWKNGAPVSGNWFSLVMEDQAAGSPDPIEEDAVNRDRVRLLLRRWGILCRPLLEHESGAFSWSKLLPAMRRMELAGELVTGRFFAGIKSLQFASPSIAAELLQADNFGGIYWMNAADPASLAGVEIEGLGYSLCARIAGSRLYYRGARLIAVSAKNGRDLQINMENSDPDMAELISLLKLPRTRSALPENKISVEKINGQDAAYSGYAACFKEAGFVSDRGKLVFW